MRSDGKVEKEDVWDVTPDKVKVLMFPVVVQAMYNALVVLSIAASDRETFPEREAKMTLRDLRNVNQVLYKLGIRPTFAKRYSDDGVVSLKHIQKSTGDSIIEEFGEEINNNKAKWMIQQYDKTNDKIVAMKKKIDDLEFRLHLFKKYGHDKE